jgi:4-hydroxybenzoate polyprenyltransferase
MMALVTGSTAYGFGGSSKQVILAGLTASFLAVGGFYLDHLADWRKDRKSGNMLNPIASGEMSPGLGLVFVIVGIGTSAVLGFLTNPQALLPLAGVVLVVSGLAAGVLDTPILRAISLGAIQGLYVLIGGLSAGDLGWGVMLTALFLLFAMTGGRVMGDVRDLPHDAQANTMTIPRKYGTRWAAGFLLVNEVIAYAIALSVYLSGALGERYLYCVLGIIIAGSVINLIFVSRPTPRIAGLTNGLSLGVLGMLYILGMVLGRN